jgi:hypothetical protein
MSNNKTKIENIKHWAMVSHQGVNPSVSFSKEEFDWLIEQAEKAERYEIALEDILNEAYEEAGLHSDNNMQLDTYISNRAKKALKREDCLYQQNSNKNKIK